MMRYGKSIVQHQYMREIVEARLFFGLDAQVMIYERTGPIVIKHYIDPVSKLAFAEEVQVV